MAKIISTLTEVQTSTFKMESYQSSVTSSCVPFFYIEEKCLVWALKRRVHAFKLSYDFVYHKFVRPKMYETTQCAVKWLLMFYSYRSSFFHALISSSAG